MQKFTDVFTEEELRILHEATENATQKYVHQRLAPLGRIEINGFSMPDSIVEKITKLANIVSEEELVMNENQMAVIYSAEYGEPTLPPHFDGDSHDLIMDFQLSSNTSWGIGVNLEVYDMEDNSALLFNPNTNIHWRPIKKFEDGEYVKMMFFRFKNPNIDNDYSYARYSQEHEIFKEVKEFRNSL